MTFEIEGPVVTVSNGSGAAGRAKNDLLSAGDFSPVNFDVWICDIDGGFFHGGTSVIINLQNSNKVFIDKGDDRKEWPISTFDEGLKIANDYLGR